MTQPNINNRASLQFTIPRSYGSAYRAITKVPPGHKRVLRFANPLHTSWGSENKNFILQQTGVTKNSEIGLVEINVVENSLLSMQCAHDATFLIYALDGHHFLYMGELGPVPLFSLTYTLQTIPEGNHRLLITPGICTLLYIVADELLLQLQSGHQTLVFLEKYIASAGKLRVLRLPVDAEVAGLIQQLMELPAEPDPFSLLFIGSKLLMQIQKHQPAGAEIERHSPANIMVFIAEHIHMPVPWLLQQLQERFSINRRLAATFLRSIHL